MKKIVVTGGSGSAGQATIQELLDHHYQVLNIDIVSPAKQLCHFTQVDLTSFGEVVGALHGADAVIHPRWRKQLVPAIRSEVYVAASLSGAGYTPAFQD